MLRRHLTDAKIVAHLQDWCSYVEPNQVVSPIPKHVSNGMGFMLPCTANVERKLDQALKHYWSNVAIDEIALA